MKIHLIEVEPLEKYPPAVMVLKSLVDLEVDIAIYTLELSDELASYCKENKVEVHSLSMQYKYHVSPLVKLKNLFYIRKRIWQEINKNKNEEDLLWVFSTITLKHLGDELLNHNYILHLFELVENLYYFAEIGKIDLKKYCQKAKNVVVCEENRAYISQVWFHLEKKPAVLPNKPYQDNIVKNNPITYLNGNSSNNSLLIEKLKEIILYQGIIDEERPLDGFIKAVDKLGDDYAFVIMGGNSDPYKDLKCKNYHYISQIPAPYHLEITSHAYIGVLSYVPNYNGYSSPLNSIYCAPNKIFEYSRFGIPMIGNDIPGLKETLETYNFGVCSESLSEIEIE